MRRVVALLLHRRTSQLYLLSHGVAWTGAAFTNELRRSIAQIRRMHATAARRVYLHANIR